MSWERKAPKEAGWYWYRETPYSGYRVIHFCWPGRVKVLTDKHARAGEPCTAEELFATDPSGQIYHPGLVAPDQPM